MPVDPDEPTVDDPRFQVLLVECLEAIERGEPLDIEELSVRYPEFADVLRGFLDDHARLVEMASAIRDGRGDFRSDPDAPTLTPNRRPQIPRTGTRLRYFGDYELLEEIARGGMGVVYKARQGKLKRVVALKMILAGKLADERDVLRFEREARAAAKLAHPNIVAVHEVGEHEGQHFFSMDFVDGPSLAAAIRDEPLCARGAAELVKSVAEAIHAAHVQGTVHRDLKPGNVLLDAEGEPHVTDFGLAKVLEGGEESSDLTTSGQILGTPSYMSPEQAEGKHDLVGPASDVYSLGAILYACLVGRPPFVAESPMDTLLQVIRDEPVPPRMLNSRIPRDLETICLKALQKRPHERYGTAELLADDLGRFLRNEPITARPIGRFERGWRWCRRNPTVASLLALVAVLLVAGTAISTSYAIAEHDQRVAADDAKVDALEAQGRAEEALTEREEALKSMRAAMVAAEFEKNVAREQRELAVQRERETREQLYVAHMNQAMSAWENDNIPRVRQLLAAHVPEEVEPDNRGFEWRYISKLVNGHLLEIPIDDDDVTHALDCSPDGRLVAIGSRERVVVHDLQSGERVADLGVRLGHTGSLDFSSDGSRLVVGAFDDRLRVYDTATFDAPRIINLPMSARQVLLPPDGTTVVTRQHDGLMNTSWIRVYDLETGRERHAIECPAPLHTSALRPDGRVVAGSDDSNVVRFWDVRSGRELRSWNCPHLSTALAYDPSGRRLALGANQRRIQVHDEDGKLVHQWSPLAGIVHDLAFHPDGERLIAGGSATTVHVFNVRTGEHLHDFRGHGSHIVDVAVRPGTHHVVSAAVRGPVKVWDLRSRDVTLLPTETDPAPALAFDPSGRTLAAARGVPWDRENPGFIELIDARTGEQRGRLDGHEGGVFAVNFDRTGQRLASAGRDGRAILWDLESGSTIREFEVGTPLSGVALWPDGTRLATGGATSVIIWDTGSGERLNSFEVQGGDIEALTVASDGRHLAACTRSGFHVWDADGREVAEGRHGGSGWSSGIAFSRDGSTFANADHQRFELYDLATGKRTAVVPAHSQRIVSLTFLPDGRRLVTKTHLGEIKVWDLGSLQSLLTLPSVDPDGWNGEPVVTNPAGDMLVAGQVTAGLLLHDLDPPGSMDDATDPEYWAEVGRQLALQRNWSLALRNFERALEIAPSPETLNDAAACALLAGNEERFRELVRTALAEAIDHVEDWSPIQCGRTARFACTLPDVVDDLAPVRTLIARNREGEFPGSADLYLLWREGDDEALLANTEELFRTSRDRIVHGNAFLLRAYAEARLGRTSRLPASLVPGSRFVEREFARATPVFSMLASLEVLRREVDDAALRALDAALDEKSDDAPLLSVRADLHRRWRRWDEACDDYRRLCDLEPESMNDLKAAAVTAVLAGRVDERQARDCDAIRKLLREPRWVTNAWSAGRQVALTPRPIDDEPLIGLVLANASGTEDWWKKIAAVAILHRAGRTDEAEEMLAVAEPLAKEWRHDALMLLWRSLIEASRGHEDEARTLLAEADLVTRDNLEPPGISTIADEVLLLRQQAHDVLDGVPSEE